MSTGLVRKSLAVLAAVSMLAMLAAGCRAKKEGKAGRSDHPGKVESGLAWPNAYMDNLRTWRSP